MASVLDFFNKEDMKEKVNNTYTTTCPDCGDDDYSCFVLFPESNTAFCHSTQRWFTFWEVYALVKGKIKCQDGRPKGGNE